MFEDIPRPLRSASFGATNKSTNTLPCKALVRARALPSSATEFA
jgi:hypothetical protein